MQRMPRPSAVAAISTSPPVSLLTFTISPPSAGRAYRRGKRVGVGRRLLFRRRLTPDITHHARVEADRRDNLLAVLQLELLLNRLAVAGRCRDVDDAARVRDAEIREEHATRARAAGERRQHRISFAQPRRREVLDLLLALHPAVARHDDDV